MRIFYKFFFILTILSSCHTQENKVDNTKPMYGLVTKHIEYGKTDEIFIKDCLKQYGSIDSSVNFHIHEAWSHYYNNSLETAMKRFNQAWLLNPKFPDSYFGFASLLETQGNNVESKLFYQMGLEKDITKQRIEECYQRIADCKEQLNDINGAIHAYSEIINLNKKNVLAFKKIGYLQMQTGFSNKALKAYHKAIELDPTDPVTYNNRGYQNQMLKNYQQAIQDYSKAIELNPNYISALVNRGLTNMQLNEYEKAKSDFEKCIILDSKAGELRRFLGLAKLSLNERSEAYNDFKLALQLGDQAASNILKENYKH